MTGTSHEVYVRTTGHKLGLNRETEEERTVYETLPTDSRSWFLKVDTHYDVEVVLRLIRIALQ